MSGRGNCVACGQDTAGGSWLIDKCERVWHQSCADMVLASISIERVVSGELLVSLTPTPISMERVAQFVRARIVKKIVTRALHGEIGWEKPEPSGEFQAVGIAGGRVSVVLEEELVQKLVALYEQGE